MDLPVNFTAYDGSKWIRCQYVCSGEYHHVGVGNPSCENYIDGNGGIWCHKCFPDTSAIQSLYPNDLRHPIHGFKHPSQNEEFLLTGAL